MKPEQFVITLEVHVHGDDEELTVEHMARALEFTAEKIREFEYEDSGDEPSPNNHLMGSFEVFNENLDGAHSRFMFGEAATLGVLFKI